MGPRRRPRTTRRRRVQPTTRPLGRAAHYETPLTGQSVPNSPYSQTGDANEVRGMRGTIARQLREVRVRATVGASERRQWDESMATHHHLPFRTLVGRSVRHVAALGERWLALVGWHAGAFRLQPRDEWIGWLPVANQPLPLDTIGQFLVHEPRQVLLELRRDRDLDQPPRPGPQKLPEGIRNPCWRRQQNHSIVAHVRCALLAETVTFTTRIQQRHAAPFNSPVHHFRP